MPFVQPTQAQLFTLFIYPEITGKENICQNDLNKTKI